LPEDLLRKYRPVGPPGDLRARLLVPEQVAWPWAVAAAALLALTVGLHAATGSRARGEYAALGDPFPFDLRVAMIADTLGGGEDARRRAWLLVNQEELERRLPQPSGFQPPETAR
jgi:hypothetical protein